jgi:dethiobiotin synthetase
MSLFLTGTDTEIGKTYVACALLRAWRAQGVHAVGMKPVATGAIPGPQGMRNDDAERLLALSHPGLRYEDINPICLEAPTAPQIAADVAGETLDLATVLTAYRRCAAQAEIVLVEGLGGWMVPLTAELVLADLVRQLALPVVLVAGIKLGAINHTLLSARAIADDGCRLVGWIANLVAPDYAYAAASIEILSARINAPLLGVVPHGDEAAADAELEGAAALLRCL